MSSLKSWITAGRLFAVPWMATNTLLGSFLAGFSIEAYLVAFAITTSVLLSAHYANAWRDYVLGFDRLNGSKAKPYTSASQLIPKGLFTVKEAKMATIGWYLIALALFLLFAPKRIDTIAIFSVASFFALTYSDIWKMHGLGEIPLFVCHGFGTVTFAYSIVKPVGLDGIAAGVLMGMFAGFLYTIDQWQDVQTDFAKKVKDMAYIIAKANFRISLFAYFAITTIVCLHVLFVMLGILPLWTLKAIALLPLFHLGGVFLEYQFPKGVIMFLIGMWMYPVLMAI